MERIPYPAPESYPPELPLANMLRMWAHSPATFRPAMALGTACVNSLSISADLGEILALYCAVKFQCQYIWARHANDARSKGVTEIQLQALQSGDLRNLSSWDKKQVAFLAFLDEVIDLPQAKEETFQEARKWFDEKQIIEIITAQGFYYMWSRIATTLRVTVDVGVIGDYEKAKDWANKSELPRNS